MGIIQACERYCGLSDAGISGVTQLLKEFTAHSNEVCRRVWHTIFTAYGGWQYEDSKQTDLPVANTTLTADQVSYAMPSAALTVRGIEVKDSAGIWSQLHPLTEEQIREFQAMGEFFKTSGRPTYYQLIGDTIRIFPASDYTQSSSFKVFFDRGSVAFASSNTTETPGFASEYHGIVPLGASIEYFMYKKPGSRELLELRNEYLRMEKNIKEYYSQRFKQMFPPRFMVRDVLRDAM